MEHLKLYQKYLIGGTSDSMKGWIFPDHGGARIYKGTEKGAGDLRKQVIIHSDSHKISSVNIHE